MTVLEKMAAAGAVSKLKKFFTRGLSSVEPEIQRGLQLRARQSSVPDSLVLWPLVGGAKMVMGPKKVENLLWNRLHKPATSANIAMGNIGHDLTKRVPGMRSLFLEKYRVPVRRGREKLLKEVKIPSATAPLTKARDVIIPFAIGLGADKALRDMQKSKKDAVSGQVQGVE